MATANVSKDENQTLFATTLEQVYCPPDLTAGIHGQYTLVSVLNSSPSVTTFLGNTLIFFALRKESSLHPPSKLLLRSLAVTDLCTGVIPQPLFAAQWVTAMNGHWKICRHRAVAACSRNYFVYDFFVDTDCD